MGSGPLNKPEHEPGHEAVRNVRMQSAVSILQRCITGGYILRKYTKNYNMEGVKGK